MLKAYAMALAVGTTAPVVDKVEESVNTPSKTEKTEVVIKDTTETEFFWSDFFSRAKKKHFGKR